MRAFHECPGHIYTDLTSINPYSANHKKVICFCCLLKHFKASLINSVDLDLFVSILMLTSKQTLSIVVILLAF